MSACLKISYIAGDFPISQIDNDSWEKATEVSVDKYWSGKDAPAGRHFRARLLWSKTALYIRFEAAQSEPLVISEAPDLTGKTNGLWERDVCEIFVAPDPKRYRHYYEFEVAPTGEWIDLAVHQQVKKRLTDFGITSGVETAARIENDRVWMALKVEWKAFGKNPSAGEKWKGNLLRCVGKGESRGYLAWQATRTRKPNFHVPTRFGEFEFCA